MPPPLSIGKACVYICQKHCLRYGSTCGSTDPNPNLKKKTSEKVVGLKTHILSVTQNIPYQHGNSVFYIKIIFHLRTYVLF